MSERQKRNRNLHLVEKSYRGEGLKNFLDHPEVEAFFNKYETDRVNEIVQCKPHEDDKRRDAAMQLAAVRRLRKAMLEVVNAGNRAKKKLELNDE